MYRRRCAPGSQSLAAAILLFASLPAGAADILLGDPALMLETGERKDLVGANSFSVEATPHGRCLRSAPRRSASALYHSVDLDGRVLVHVQWWWRVDQLQPSADIRRLETEDVGAMIMFVFGEPSLFNRDVPTLAYVWTATPTTNGAILPSRRFSSLAYIQLRGRGDVEQWRQEARDVAADFQLIFGHAPGRLRYVAVFNDNDQTGEAASALLCPIMHGP